MTNFVQFGNVNTSVGNASFSIPSTQTNNPRRGTAFQLASNSKPSATARLIRERGASSPSYRWAALRSLFRPNRYAAMDTVEAAKASPEQYRKTWLKQGSSESTLLITKNHRTSLLVKFFSCEVVAEQKFVGPNLKSATGIWQP